VVDASSASGRIMPDDLDRFGIPDGETRLLFRTANSDLWNEPGFSPAFVALDPSAAAALAERGAVLVAADYLSVAPFGEPGPTHHALLDAGVVIVEGLDLRAVEPGPYDLICLPLRIVGCDGAPARALVRRRGGSRIR
jgi:arylformamidase